MAASLISYFCTMVTDCTILIAIMNQFVSPPTFRQPHPIAAFKHSHKAAEPGESPSAQSSTTLSTARASEAVSSELQKEKQALYRPRRPSPKGRAREHDNNPEIVSAVGYARKETGVASLYDRAWSPVAERRPWQDQWNMNDEDNDRQG
jgi:hypothetical protein